MKHPFTEKTFCIDLVSTELGTDNPLAIADEIYNIFKIRVTVSEVIDYLDLEEDLEQQSFTIRMKEIFN